MSYTKCKRISIFNQNGKWYMRIFGTANNVYPYDWQEIVYPKTGEGFSTEKEAHAKALRFYIDGEIHGNQIYSRFIDDCESGKFDSPAMKRLRRIHAARDKAYSLAGMLWDGKTLYNNCFTVEGSNWKRYKKILTMRDNHVENGFVDEFYRWAGKAKTETPKSMEQMNLF